MFNANTNGYAQQPQMGFNGGIPQGTGYQYNGNPQPVKFQNNLSDDEIQHLVKNENTFSLMITNEEKLRSICNHRWQNGTDAIVEEADGKCRCNICGYEFIPLDANISVETLQDYTANILDVLQTIKILYVNMPPESAREFFVIIPLIEKIPKLFELAVKNWAKYESFDPYRYDNRNMGTMALFNMLAASLNNGNGFAMPQQGQPMPQPGMNPQMGMPQQPYGFQQPPMSNGFGYNGAAGYQPQMNNFQYDPMNFQQPQQAAPQAATQPAATQATTDGTTVDVTAKFQA